MTIGDKQPYGIDEETDWFIPACAEKRRIPHCLIEVRNDHLSDDDGCRLWADHLYSLMTHFMESVDATDP
jgi:predicted N-formylglutamate amidohydrolase